MALPTHRQRNVRPRWLASALLIVGILATATTARAQIGSSRYSSIVIDAASGTVLSAVNADQLRYPASLVKVMTIYMVFEAIRDRRISLGQLVPVSLHAASMEPTKLGLVPGTQITVEQAVLGLVTKSANDAAAALAELLGGTEQRFAQMMTLRAHAIGMSSTHFENASGLPDPNQVTTARDLALLARRMIADFPGYYRYFSAPSFVWHGRTIFNHHRLLQSYPGADGLKTGYTHASGYNLITSSVRGGVRLIGVVLGAASIAERDNHMVALLNASYNHLDIPDERRPATTQVAHRGSLVGSAQAAEPTRTVTAPRGRQPVLAWAIQVGSFRTERQARAAAAAGRRLADGGEIRIETAVVNRKPYWRAQVTGLSQQDAASACQAMARRKAPCIVMKADSRQVATR